MVIFTLQRAESLDHVYESRFFLFMTRIFQSSPPCVNKAVICPPDSTLSDFCRGSQSRHKPPLATMKENARPDLHVKIMRRHRPHTSSSPVQKRRYEKRERKAAKQSQPGS